jgi:VWFA-related protein
MKYFLMITAAFVITIIFIFVNPIASQSRQQDRQDKILERVEVNWWQVPVFAVDKAGNPVMDLEAADIAVWMNHQPIETFRFYKRPFQVIQLKKEKTEQKKPVKPVLEIKDRMVFLLFDLTVSNRLASQRAKTIAKKIIEDSEKNIRFVVMTIEPFIGLKFLGEVTGDRDKLLNVIEKEVKPKRNSRIPDFSMIAAQIEGKRGGRLSSGEKGMLTEQVSEYYKRKSANFFESFETLNYFLNTVEESKFVYFFSEGLSNAVIETIRGGRSMYRSFLEKVSQHLGRCGAVLFVINPNGVDHGAEPGETLTHLSPGSGEDSMAFLAQETGGKYLEGTPEKISQRIENLHRAYYEIAFPDVPGMKGTSRKITVKSFRKGVVIHSLRSLEKRKTYSQMNNVEKELTALNLLHPGGLLKSNMPTQDVKIKKIKKSKNKVVYYIRIPENYLRQSLDLYKFQFTGSNDNPEVTRIEKESIRFTKNKEKIEFQLIENKSNESRQSLKTYFAFMDGGANRALVCGTVSHDNYMYPLPTEKNPFEKMRSPYEKGEQIIAPGEMKKILDGAAGYCEKLKQSAFHFICDEKIVETMNSIMKHSNVVPNITTRTRYETRNRGLLQMQDNVRTRVNKYRFSYRLIKNNEKVSEKREIIKIKGDNPENINVTIRTYGDADRVVKPTRFFSQKAIFAPVTMLAEERQSSYNYRFIMYDKRKDRRNAVIEVIPKDPAAAYVYGIVWIDLENYSVTRIEADPRSIRGYDQLKEFGRKLQTKLYLSLGIDFDFIQNDIRFPTRVTMLERYKGGPYVRRYSGLKGWERNRTEFTYSNYQFFDIKVDVVEEKMK